MSESASLRIVRQNCLYPLLPGAPNCLDAVSLYGFIMIWSITGLTLLTVERILRQTCLYPLLPGSPNCLDAVYLYGFIMIWNTTGLTLLTVERFLAYSTHSRAIRYHQSRCVRFLEVSGGESVRLWYKSTWKRWKR